MPLRNPRIPTLVGLMQSKPLTLLLSKSLDISPDLAGSLRTVASGGNGDFVSDFPVGNNHIFFLVNSIVGAGDVIITGVSTDESTGVSIVDDTEIMSITEMSNQYWQSKKKWWEGRQVSIPASISSINYDIGVVGYPDFGNRDFKIIGYRLDAKSNGKDPSFMFQILKVKDDGEKRMSIVYLENLGIDSGAIENQVVDALRMGENDRSLNPAGSVWLEDTIAVLKCGDFDTFFSNEQNHFSSFKKDEGYILRLAGLSGGDISNVDFVTIDLRYVLT